MSPFRKYSLANQPPYSALRQASNISTLAFDEQYTYPFNNYLFKVQLATPAFISTFPGTQPGTCRAPSDGVSLLVIKLSNPAAHDVNNTNRVANDVAAQYLVRKSMAKAGQAPLVPDVYAWAPTATAEAVDEEKFGWIMSELRGGVDLDSEFSSLSLEDKKDALKQMAAIFGAIQAASLPKGVTKFGGGLQFDSNGHIVSGESPYAQDLKPAGSYAEWRTRKLRSRIERAAESTMVGGWNSNGVATKIEAFLASGGPEKVMTGVDVHRKCLIHGDLSACAHPLNTKSSKLISRSDQQHAI